MTEVVTIQDSGLHEDHGQHYIEASSAGLTPGQWPELISLNGKVFEKGIRHYHDDELISVEYVTTRGDRLTILND